MSRLRVVLILAALAGIIGAGPAFAQDAESERLELTTHIDDYPSVVMEIAGVNMTGTLDPTLFVIEEDGKPVKGVEIVPMGETTPTGVVLVIDASNSMEGQKLEEAKNAALAFVDQKQAQDEVAVIAFGPPPFSKLPFTSDQDELRSFIESIELLGSQTPLYDAVYEAAQMFARDADLDANAIVLTDGVNTERSTTHTLEEATSAARDVGMTIFSVGIVGSDFAEEPLQEMAVATGGVYASADPDELVELFRRIGSALDNRVVARFEASQSEHVEVTFGVIYADELVETQSVLVPGYLVSTTSVTTTVPQAPPSTYYRASSLPASPNTLRILIAVAAFAVVVMFVLILAWGREDEDRVGGRLRAYGTPQTTAGDRGGILSRLPIFGYLAARAEAVAQRRGLTGAINTALDSANILLRPGEAIAAAIALAALAGGVVAVVMRSLLWGGAVFLLAVLITFALVERAGRGERSRFDQQLPDTLTLMATSLRAGYSLVQAIESVASESPDPTGREFSRAVAETRLGRPAVQALQGIADRMTSEDFHWTVMAIEIQREVGGNLSEVLQTVADTMVARNRLRGEVKALTAEGRISAIVLVLIPFGLFVFLFVTNPDFLAPLINNTVGIAALTIAGLLMVVGVFWLRRLVKIEV